MLDYGRNVVHLGLAGDEQEDFLVGLCKPPRSLKRGYSPVQFIYYVVSNFLILFTEYKYLHTGLFSEHHEVNSQRRSDHEDVTEYHIGEHPARKQKDESDGEGVEIHEHPARRHGPELIYYQYYDIITSSRATLQEYDAYADRLEYASDNRDQQGFTHIQELSGHALEEVPAVQQLEEDRGYSDAEYGLDPEGLAQHQCRKEQQEHIAHNIGQ